MTGGTRTLRCPPERLSAYFADMSELSRLVTDSCAAVASGVPGFDALPAEAQDSAVDQAFVVPTRVGTDGYAPDVWGKSVVRDVAFLLSAPPFH